MSLAVLFHFLYAQHVSDINISIIRSLRLFCWITTLVGLLFFKYHNDERSNKHKIHKIISSLYNFEVLWNYLFHNNVRNCTSYRYSVSVQLTDNRYLYSLRILGICTVYGYSVFVQLTDTRCLCSLRILGICTAYGYSVSVQLTDNRYLYSLQILGIYLSTNS